VSARLRIAPVPGGTRGRVCACQCLVRASPDHLAPGPHAPAASSPSRDPTRPAHRPGPSSPGWLCSVFRTPPQPARSPCPPRSPGAGHGSVPPARVPTCQGACPQVLDAPGQRATPHRCGADITSPAAGGLERLSGLTSCYM